MTKAELLQMAQKLQAEAEAMPDETGESASTTVAEDTSDKKPEKGPDNEANGDPKPAEKAAEQETNSNDELEEPSQIEPQTNGAITDDITPKVDATFEESTSAAEPVGTEAVLESNMDARLGTMLQEITALKMEQDKIKVALSQILTRIELVQEVTDKVVSPIDHDALLSQAVNLLV